MAGNVPSLGFHNLAKMSGKKIKGITSGVDSKKVVKALNHLITELTTNLTPATKKGTISSLNELTSFVENIEVLAKNYQRDNLMSKLGQKVKESTLKKIQVELEGIKESLDILRKSCGTFKIGETQYYKKKQCNKGIISKNVLYKKNSKDLNGLIDKKTKYSDVLESLENENATCYSIWEQEVYFSVANTELTYIPICTLDDLGIEKVED